MLLFELIHAVLFPVICQAQGTFDNVWMAQVTGSTHVVLEPVEDCEDKCEKFEFTLKQGDVCMCI